MSEYNWADYADSPEDGQTIMDLIAEGKQLRAEAEKLAEALEKLDTWQGNRPCDGSVYSITDDDFENLQSTIHAALAAWREKYPKTTKE